MPRPIKRRRDGSNALPMVCTKEDPKDLPIIGPKAEHKITENIYDHDLEDEEVLFNGFKFFARRGTRRDLVEAPMEGGFAFSSSGYASGSSKKAFAAPESLNCAPTQEIQVVRFPKNEIQPRLVWKNTIDVKADKHHGDAKLGHIPDFREDWGDGEKWKLYRKAYYVYVAPTDIPEVKLHGKYVVFATWDPSYAKSTHKLIAQVDGRHLHEDFFIAKIGRYPDGNGSAAYVNMPDEFLSATTRNGYRLYQIPLAETGQAMLEKLRGW